VELQDTREAFRLVKDSLHSYAIDPLTGKIDMDMINTGKSNSWREQIQELKRQLRLFLDKADRNLYDLQALMNAFRTHSSIV
jgi:DNA replication licensing factor MCM4